MPQAPSPIVDRKSYALYHRFGAWRFSWLNSDPGVSLTDDRIGWLADGRESEASLREIAEVHLQTGSVGENTIASCRLTFGDGSTLLVASNSLTTPACPCLAAHASGVSL